MANNSTELIKDIDECEKKRQFANYKTESVLGEGAYGKVYKVIYKPTSTAVALKIFKPINNAQALLQKEIQSLEAVYAVPNFVQIFSPIDLFHEKYRGIAMQFCEGGDLLKYVILKKGLCEQDVRGYLHQIIAIIESLQSRNLVHLDIKADNFFLDKDFNLVLGDFGMCEQLETSNQMLTLYSKGSPGYMIPEILHQVPYSGFQADIFAAGVTFFSLFTCCLPFKQNPVQQYNLLFTNPQKFWYTIQMNSPNEEFKSILNKNFVNLFMRMVSPNPSQRITVAEIKQHPFYLGDQVMELTRMNMKEVNDQMNSQVVETVIGTTSETAQTRGHHKSSILENFEKYEYSVDNLLKNRQAKVQEIVGLSDFTTNIDCETLFQFLFINQEDFTSELPKLSDKSFKLKCVYQTIQETDNSAQINQFATDEALESFFKSLSIDVGIQSQPSSSDETRTTTDEQIKFDICVNINPTKDLTIINFVKKSGDAFAFFEIVAKIQSLILSFQ